MLSSLVHMTQFVLLQPCLLNESLFLELYFQRFSRSLLHFNLHLVLLCCYLYFAEEMTFSAKYSISILLNRCLNTIDRLYTHDIIPPDPFQRFSLFDPTHWGVRGSFRGRFGRKLHFLLYYPFGSS